MSEVLDKISRRYLSLNPAEQLVAAYVQSNPEEAAVHSLQALASAVGTSDTTVLRFCRSIGYTGFQDFKLSLLPELLTRGAPVREQLESGQTASGYGMYRDRVSDDVTTTLNNLRATDIQRSSVAIRNAYLTTIIGVASSNGIAKVLENSLRSIGINAQSLSDRVEIERKATMFRSDEVVIGISHSGTAPEVAIGLERARERGAFTIAVTNFSPSLVSEAAEVTLLTYSPEGLIGSLLCHPRVLQLVVLMVLLTEVTSMLSEGTTDSK